MSESTRLIAENMSLLSTLMTPVAIIMAVFFAYTFGLRFLKNYERNQQFTREEMMLQREQLDLARAQVGNSSRAQTSITIAGDPSSPGGYDFVQVPDEFKSIFLEAMSGFRDYAGNAQI